MERKSRLADKRSRAASSVRLEEPTGGPLPSSKQTKAPSCAPTTKTLKRPPFGSSRGAMAILPIGSVAGLRPDLADDSPGAMPRPPGHHSLTFGVPASLHAVGSRSQKSPAGSPKAFRRELRRRVESLPAGAARGGNVWRLAACHEACSRSTGSRGDTGR